LTPCSTNADCIDADETCASLNDAQGQTYCLPTTKDDADDLQQLLNANAPGKHQAYSKQLAQYGMLRPTKLFCSSRLKKYLRLLQRSCRGS